MQYYFPNFGMYAVYSPYLNKDFLSEINKIIFKFLWNNKNPEPIAQETLLLPRERGGL